MQNEKISLRPIGTEFTVDLPLSQMSSDACPYRITYRIIAYRECIDEKGRTFTGEEVETVRITDRKEG